MAGEKILILTDSSSTISQEVAKANEVEVLPLQMVRNDGIEFGEQSLTMNSAAIGKMLDEGYTFKTSCTPIGRMEDTIVNALQKYDSIIAIPISSGWSSQYDHLKTFEDRFPGRIAVCDTREYGYCLEFLALKLRKRINQGLTDLMVLKTYAETLHEYASSFIALRKLDGAVASGRVPKIISKFAKWAKVYPILKFEYVNHLKNVLRRWEGGAIKKSLENFYNEYPNLNAQEIRRMVVLTANNPPSEVAEAKRQIREILGYPEDKILIREAPIILHTVVWNGAMGFELIAKVKKSKYTEKANLEDDDNLDKSK